MFVDYSTTSYMLYAYMLYAINKKDIICHKGSNKNSEKIEKKIETKNKE